MKLLKFLVRVVSRTIDFALRIPLVHKTLITLVDKILAVASADVRSDNKRIAARSIACWVIHQVFKTLLKGTPKTLISVEEQVRPGLVIYLAVQSDNPNVQVTWSFWPGNEDIVKDVEGQLRSLFTLFGVSFILGRA